MNQDNEAFKAGQEPAAEKKGVTVAYHPEGGELTVIHFASRADVPDHLIRYILTEEDLKPDKEDDTHN